MKKLLITATFLCGAAHAQTGSILYTGQDLYTRLSSTPIWAYGYIAGVADSQSGVTICIPSNTVSVGQMSDMVKQLLETAPSERHLSADIYIQAALSNRWPCTSKKGSRI